MGKAHKTKSNKTKQLIPCFVDDPVFDNQSQHKAGHLAVQNCHLPSGTENTH